jgi:hypothetical protein
MHHKNAGQIHNKQSMQDIACAFLFTIGLDDVTMEMKVIATRWAIHGY